MTIGASLSGKRRTSVTLEVPNRRQAESEGRPTVSGKISSQTRELSPDRKLSSVMSGMSERKYSSIMSTKFSPRNFLDNSNNNNVHSASPSPASSRKPSSTIMSDHDVNTLSSRKQSSILNDHDPLPGVAFCDSVKEKVDRWRTQYNDGHVPVVDSQRLMFSYNILQKLGNWYGRPLQGYNPRHPPGYNQGYQGPYQQNTYPSQYDYYPTQQHYYPTLRRSPRPRYEQDGSHGNISGSTPSRFSVSSEYPE